MKKFEIKSGHEIRGMMIRLYPDKETEECLKALEADARRVWNWLVGQTEDVIKARAAYAMRNGLVPARPETPCYDGLTPDESLKIREHFVKMMVEWHMTVHKATKDVVDCQYRTVKELMAHFGCKYDYQLLQRVDSWYEGQRPVRAGAHFFQALMKNYFSRGVNQRRKKFRKKTDPMPLQVRSGGCFEVGNFGKRGKAHSAGAGDFYNCRVSFNGLKIRGRLPGKNPDGRVLEGVSITQRAGSWWASIKVEVPVRQLPEPVPGTVIGIDVGLDFIAAMSDGRRIKNNRAKMLADRIAGAQKRCADYRVQGHPIDKLEKMSWRLSMSAARHTRHEIYNRILKPLEEVETIKIEALSSKIGQMGSKKVSAMRLVRSMLVERFGSRVREVEPHYTSQECSQCGHRSKESWSYEHGRIGECPACGFRCDRDVNAARNIAAKPAISLDA